jgi:hypothetical protein
MFNLDRPNLQSRTWQTGRCCSCSSTGQAMACDENCIRWIPNFQPLDHISFFFTHILESYTAWPRKKELEKNLMLKFSFFEKTTKVNEISKSHWPLIMPFKLHHLLTKYQLSTDQFGCLPFFKTCNLKREDTRLPLFLLNCKVNSQFTKFTFGIMVNDWCNGISKHQSYCENLSHFFSNLLRKLDLLYK